VFATVPDLLRLLVVPAFAWVAYRDIRTRRVPNRTWLPLAALAVVLLVWELGPLLFAGDVSVLDRRRLVRTAVSVGLLVPLVYGFWLVGGFGGADAKAFFVVALLLPTYPTYDLAALGLDAPVLPLVETSLGVFSLTVLTNTVLLGVGYPLALAARNALSGYVSPGMFFAKPVAVADLPSEYGTLLEFPDRPLSSVRSPAGLRSYLSYRGLDIDALRMYLQYRGLTLAELRADPDRYRDPDSLPAEPNHPGDGSIPDTTVVTDGGPADPAEGGPEPDTETDERTDGSDDDPDDRSDPDTETDEGADDGEPVATDADPWGAAAFLEDIEGSAYGTTPERLRAGLDTVVSEDVVWVSPGIPFLVPMFFGIVASLTVGDILFGLLGLLGFV
jgi:preflagellin peptidase FlaK